MGANLRPEKVSKEREVCDLRLAGVKEEKGDGLRSEGVKEVKGVI